MEIWDLYDKYRNKLDITMKKGDEVPDNCYRLAGNICVFNNLGEMLIQQRSSLKNTYPNLWDTTARGSAVSGESSEDAAKRELKEEIGVELGKENIDFCLTIHSEEWFSDIYVVRKEVDISNLILNKDEVSSVKWANKSEIIEMIELGSFVPYESDLISLIFSKAGM